MENSTATHSRQPALKDRHGSPAASGSRRPRLEAGAKRTLDLSAALALVVLLLPILLAIAIAVKLGSRGPVLFRQRRLGRHMEPFTVLKFRTMAADSSPEIHKRFIAELASSSQNGNGQEDSEELKKLTTDPRVTRVGRFLRRTSLDELPQLFNVIAGQMSLVGPRPALEYELEHYRPHHYKRFDVRPGITGLWQVSGRSRLDFLAMLDLDAEYSEDQRVGTDLRILLRTPVAAFRHSA